MQYRREIDGLRAFAVLPVMFFHAGFGGFGGGFVGVDVFFVISGYLITGIIRAEQAGGMFSMVNFYERRARRILPALFVVIAACIPVAWIWLMPGDMSSFSKSLVAVSVFSSNVFFWRESGYFDAAAELKPLLHTWSLAVEEQYYLLFPVFLMLAWRLGKKWIVVMISVLAVCSLAAAHWGVEKNPEATFFLLPARGWELFLGALVSIYLEGKQNVERNRAVEEIASAIGFGLLLYAIFLFDKNTPFPSLYALVPTCGAALIILFATQRTFVGKFLGASPLVGVGLISYSAYLWHQPLFAFARHASENHPDLLDYAALSLAALVLAYVSWRWVEKPFRDRQRINRTAIFLIAISGSVAVAAFGYSGYRSEGFSDRFSGERKEFASYFDNKYPDWNYFHAADIYRNFRFDCNFYDIPKFLVGENTKIPRPALQEDCYLRNQAYPHSVFVWGDSHAQHLNHGLKANLPASWQLLQVASSGCEAQIRHESSDVDYCRQSNYFALESIRKARPDVVIIGQNSNHDAARMRELRDHLSGLGVGKVLFTGPVPHWKGGLPGLMTFKLWNDTPRYTSHGLNPVLIQKDKELKAELARDGSIHYVSIIDYFCNDQGCLTYIGDDRKRGITTFDDAHLSAVASDALARDVLVPLVLAK